MKYKNVIYNMISELKRHKNEFSSTLTFKDHNKHIFEIYEDQIITLLNKIDAEQQLPFIVWNKYLKLQKTNKSYKDKIEDYIQILNDIYKFLKENIQMNDKKINRKLNESILKEEVNNNLEGKTNKDDLVELVSYTNNAYGGIQFDIKILDTKEIKHYRFNTEKDVIDNGFEWVLEASKVIDNQYNGNTKDTIDIVAGNQYNSVENDTNKPNDQISYETDDSNSQNEDITNYDDELDVNKDIEVETYDSMEILEDCSFYMNEQCYTLEKGDIVVSGKLIEKLPEPKSGESKSDFINRAMKAMGDEDKPQNKKLAIAYSIYKDKKKDESILKEAFSVNRNSKLLFSILTKIQDLNKRKVKLTIKHIFNDLNISDNIGYDIIDYLEDKEYIVITKKGYDVFANITNKGNIFMNKKKESINKNNKLNESKPYEIIMDQLNWNRLKAMIGIQYPSYGDNGYSLNFRWKARGNGKANFCKITLTNRDLYNIQFGKIRGLDYKVVKEFKDIYADQLLKIFGDYNQLDTSL